MTTLTAIILKVTGYRFPKHEGLFCRGSLGRAALKLIGVSAIGANVKADLM